MTFKEDLELGCKYEHLAIDYYISKGYHLFKQSQGLFKPYDFIVVKDDEVLKVEVKCDRLAFKTGNLCIEYKCNNKPSGITSTEADVYFYFILKNDKYDLYEIPTMDLKQFIKDKLYHRDMSGGNGYRSKFYLFKKHLFEDYLLF